ncbi:beta strand repeat-containing protein [Coleofasciculus chthonoplastes]|uniref:beta strand repeat-containing protein n=1 Tax=Coleofasciculus chthonoplastes TaxID=64178 RepID=UPI0005C588E2|nr:filamentous hemagglutinin N-terminal domain-containing protein [Coleofasciculus chthonoplastes]
MHIITFLKQGRSLTFPLVWLTLFNPAVQAQLIPDNTLGTEASIITPQGVRDLIEGGAKRGSNLFHSFTEFNVSLDQQVYFANPEGIANILTRVTGDNRSNIFGTLGVDGNANLFLLNPNGILFGVDAKLDVAGSFVASTADGIQLGNDGVFRATNPQNSQLLAIQPGVLFLDALRQQQAEIRNQGQLSVEPGQTLTLAGDRVISTGSLTAPGGTIQVFGEEVQLLETARINVSSLTGGGSVAIGQGEQVTIAAEVQIKADSLNQGDGGRVIIRGNETTQFEGTITARGASDNPQSNGGFVDVSGGYLEFTGIVDTTAPLGEVGTLLLDPKNIWIQADGSDSADGQTFETNPTEVSIINGNVLSSALATNSVTLQANNDIAINQSIFSPSSNSLTLQAGRSITIADNLLILLNGGDFIAKINDENAIADQRDAGVAQFLMNPGSTLTSLGGRIEITSGTFADTSQINTANSTISSVDVLGNSGRSGDISLFALGNVTTGLVNTGRTIGGDVVANNGGNITIKSENGAIATTDFVTSDGINQAGEVVLEASGDLNVNQNITSTSTEGIGGNITLNSEKGAIATSAMLISDSLNQAGDISVDASENLDINGNISSRGEIGGNITLNSEKGAIATTASLVSDGINQAGKISVDAAGTLTTMGTIIANSQNQAGDISLHAIGDVSINRNINAMGEIGGNITLKSENGGITTTAALVSNSLNQGGDISVEAHENLSINQNIASRGEIGGNITLKSENGAITTTAALVSEGSNQAGDISVDAAGDLNTMGNIVANSENQAGDISLNAIGDLSVNKTIASDGNFAGQITLNSGGLFWNRGNTLTNSGRLPGVAKGITITAQSILVEDASIFSFAFNEAQGGMVQVNAADDIVIRNSNLGTSAAPVPGSAEMSSADAGDINLNTRRLTIIQDPETTFPFGVGVGSNTDLSNSGNAGNVTINATESIEIIGNQPGAFNPNSVELAQIPLQGDTGISTSALGSGNSGNLTINTGRLSIRDGGGITTFVNQGEGGDLTVNATDVFLQGEGGIGTGTLGEDAGDLTLNAENVTLTDGALISTSTGRDGNAGNLTLDVRNLSLRNGAGVLGNTGADGNGGQLTIKNAELIEVIGRSADGSFPSSIATDLFSPNESGNAGDIDITSQELIVQQGGEITSATRGFGDGGNVRLNLESLRLDNGRINASTSRSGKGGNIQIRASDSIEVIGAGFEALQEKFVRPAFADTLTLDSFSQGIVTVTDGEGRAGNVFIETPNFIARDGGLIATTTLNQGRGGNIQIDATNRIELDNSLLGSGTFDQAASGNVTLTSPRLVARGGAQVLTTTFNSGQAGDLNVNVSESIELSDPNNQGTLLGTGLFASSTEAASGDGGDININSPTSELNIRDRAAVSVSATGTGNAGDINIDVRSLLLDQGLISATSLSGEGGNINLKVAETFILRNNSQLSTRAGTETSGGGNGGDMTIDANFIVAVLSENSDIIANAFEGNGGNITINTQTILGLQLSEILTPNSDIIASSELGIDGSIVINTPNIDPSRGLIELPSTFSDPSGQIISGCPADTGDRFVVTGRGGIPHSPGQYLSGRAIWEDTRRLSSQSFPSSTPTNSQLSQTNTPPLIEAQGWVVDQDGTVILTAEPYRGKRVNIGIDFRTCGSQ